MNFVGKRVLFTDGQLSLDKQLGYFLQLTHSTVQDMDYAYVVDEDGKIHCIFVTEIEFDMLS
jgi:hypothetical protein